MISNRSTTNVPARWQLQLTYTGQNPAVLWPADWQRGANGALNTMVNDPLNVNRPLTILLDDSLTTRISTVKINEILATRES